MLYIPKIDYYLGILTDEELKDFVAMHFSEYFESIREKQNLRKIAQSFYICTTTFGQLEKYEQPNSSDNCIHHYKVEIMNLFDPELQLINTSSVIKNKLKELLSEIKRQKVQTVLVLDDKKRNDHKIFHSSAKLIARDSDIDKVYIESMHQSIITNKIYPCKDWIVLDTIIKHSIKTLSLNIKRTK